MQVFFHIISNNILPVFILITLGFGLNRVFTLDIHTLTKLNFYIFVPIFLLSNLYATDISGEFLRALVFPIAFLVLMGLAGKAYTRYRKHDPASASAVINATMFYNSGNMGLPLVTLVFSSAPFAVAGYAPYLSLAVAIQVGVMMVQNVSTYTIGFINAGVGQLSRRESLLSVFRMPNVYIIPLAILLRSLPFQLEATFLWPAMEYVKGGMVALALITLGVQLSNTRYQFGDLDVYYTAAIRLIGGPALALVLIHLFRFDGVIAQALFISSAMPTAMTTALIAVECRNKPDFASQTVMTSTLLSTFSLTLVIYLAQILFPLEPILA